MILVEPDQLSSVWAEVEPWIKAALEYGQGDENILDVLVSLACGRYLLWYEPGRFAGVVQVVQYPRQKVATIIYAGAAPGHLEEMAEAVENGKAWCRQNHIGVIRVHGRKGWQRILGLVRKGVILQGAVA